MTSKINFITNFDDYQSEFVNFINNLLHVIYQNVHETNQNHIMIDVGANIGEITAVLLRHINPATGKIVAIDAHPHWLEKFEFANHPRVQSHNLGCYSFACERKFVAEDKLTAAGYFGLTPCKPALEVDKLKSFSIKCDTLDNIINTDGTISFIKIDAESADFEVLLGSKNILIKHRPFIVFEFSGQIFERAHGHSRNDFFNFFNTHNYHLYSVGEGRSQDFLAKSWDIYNYNLRDILAVPAEYSYLATNNNTIMEKA